MEVNIKRIKSSPAMLKVFLVSIFHRFCTGEGKNYLMRFNFPVITFKRFFISCFVTLPPFFDINNSQDTEICLYFLNYSGTICRQHFTLQHGENEEKSQTFNLVCVVSMATKV
jgi:hypothetical protein